MVWDPAQYSKFADHRLRPALDLLARVPLEAPSTVVDLGCGTGAATARLAEQWPRAAVAGVDRSPEMLSVAQQRHSAISWVEAGLGNWSPDEPVDLLFSNAALHWLDEHATLFPRLLQHVAPGGALAVQMPRNFAAPMHALVDELALSPRWRTELAGLVKPPPVAEPGAYYDLLAPDASSVDLWETEYFHSLTGERPVLEWIKGTWMRPFLERLSSDEARAFEDAYDTHASAAYPRRPDGVTLLPFRRLFIVALR